MNGFYQIRKGSFKAHISQPDASLGLLASLGSVDIMVQEVNTDRTFWIEPSEDSELSELFYILEGSIIVNLPEGKQTFSQGDMFYVSSLEGTLSLTAPEYSRLLYITTKPEFQYLSSYINDLNALLNQLEAKDRYTHNHGRRVQTMATKISELMDMNQKRIDRLVIAAMFHDVGKCFIPDEVLNKPGSLTPSEFKYIYKHPLDSAMLLSGKFDEETSDIASQHHENMDGTGYPNGLSGRLIRVEARIISVADTYDAITTDRSYHKARSPKEAYEIIRSLAGTRFDRRVVRALRKVLIKEGLL